MYIEIIPAGGIGRERPLRLEVSQVLVFQDNGTPVVVAGEYGLDNSQVVSTVWENDFNECLAALGIRMTTVVDTLHLPEPPPGARLIAGPRRN